METRASSFAMLLASTFPDGKQLVLQVAVYAVLPALGAALLGARGASSRAYTRIVAASTVCGTVAAIAGCVVRFFPPVPAAATAYVLARWLASSA